MISVVGGKSRKLGIPQWRVVSGGGSGNRRRRAIYGVDTLEYLRQASGTAAASGPTISVGPCLDSTGAEYTGLVIGDLTLTKNGTSAAMAANATLTATSNGFYDLVMIGNNADTTGRLLIRSNKSTYQIPPREFMVLPATVYDAIVTNATNATGGLLAATGSIAGITGTIANTTNITAGTITTVSGNVTGNVGGNVTGNVGSVVGAVGSIATGGIAAASFATGAIDASAIATDAIGSAEISAAAVTKIQAGLATPTNITAGVITTVTTVTNQLTAAAIATGVWTDTVAGDFTTALSVGKSVMNGVALGTGLTVARSTLVDTLTTYTGNTLQTGDSFARIGALGVGLTSVAIVSGGITSASFAAGAITAASIATDAIDADALAASAVTEIWAASTALTTAQTAAAVWNALTASYGTAGTYGEALEAVGASADPWLTNLPGAYGAGTAGYIIGTNLNATVSSRASQTSLDTLDDYVDTEVAAMQAVLVKVDTMLVLDVAVYQLTANALELAPTGSSGGSSSTPSIQRGTTELTPIYFTFPTASLADAAFTTQTKRIDGATAANITGAITYLYSYGGLYWYSIAYDASDRPASAAAGVVQYVLSDGTSTVAIDLRVSDIAASSGGDVTDEFVKRGLHELG